ncbi:MAG: PilW family protein [Pseudomonadota bacterium]
MEQRKLNTQQSGFSILELMIALMLGLVIIAGIVQLFTGNSRTYELVSSQSRVQENARFAFEFISASARRSGYYGCAPETNNLAKHLVGNWNVIPEYDITAAVNGFEAQGDGTYLPNDLLTLPRTEGATNLNVHIAGNGIDGTVLDPNSDVLLFRSVGEPFTRLATTLQPDADPVVYTPGGEPQFNVNDVVIISDCEQAAMIRVTGVVAGANQTTLSYAQGVGNFDNGANITTMDGDVIAATLSTLGRSYGQATTVGAAQTTVFFIAPSADLNNRDQEVMALWRKVGPDAPVELIQGVQNMQVHYGVDLSNDDIRNVNRYQTIDQVADVDTIVAVRVRLDVFSPDVLAETGTQLTRSFSKTIMVRNAGV